MTARVRQPAMQRRRVEGFAMMSIFARYASIGVVNTLLHWVVFAALVWSGLGQALANLLAFAAAVTFSFAANARWTFSQRATGGRYLAYVAFMGALAALTGWGADRLGLHPLLTLVVFSAISLVVGFLYSRFIVFRSAS